MNAAGMSVSLHPGRPEIVLWNGGGTAWFLRDTDYDNPPDFDRMSALDRRLLVTRLRAWADQLEVKL